MHHPFLRSLAALSALGSMITVASLLPTDSEAVQVRRDAIGALGGASAGPAYRLMDTAGLPVIGRSTRPGVALWSGFWIPASQGVSSTPDDLPGEFDVVSRDLPLRTRLAGIWPNPVRRTASLRYEIAPRPADGAGSTAHTRLELYDVTGRLAATLFDGASAPGFHQLTWETGREKSNVPNGVYLLRFHSGDHAETRRVVLLR